MRRFGWSALALAAFICGCGGGTTFNPTPAITGLFPTGITAGSQSFTLLLGGTGFQSNTTAQWNGVNRPAVFNDTTGQVAVTILATDVASPGVAQITVANPAPGGGTSNNALSFQIHPPSVNGPVITQIAPAQAVVGASSVTVKIDGTNLATTDAITWNGTVLSTSNNGTPAIPPNPPIPPTELTAVLGAEDFTAAFLGSVGVQTNTPGVAATSVAFPVGPSTNPAPKLTSILPATTPIQTIPAGSYIILNGSGFVPSSVVLFNGSPFQSDGTTPRAVGYSSSSQLAVAIYSADVAGGGTFAITVKNPSPGGGTSGAVDFTVK